MVTEAAKTEKDLTDPTINRNNKERTMEEIERDMENETCEDEGTEEGECAHEEKPASQA